MRKIIAVLILICFLFAFTSCGGNSNIRLVYDLGAEPKTLDPQCATDLSAKAIIENSFEGLFTENKNGEIVYGVTEDLEVSSDKLTYTFTLKSDLKWSNDYKLTAHDFEFAFKRLFAPSTKYPNAESFFFIKNSEKIFNGELSLDQLGVKAISDTKLVIECEYYTTMFEKLLSTTPAMPCNEKFFNETKGEYGLESESIISNGSFETTVWYHNEYIKLMSNEHYHDYENVNLSNMTLWLGASYEESFKRFENGNSQLIPFEGDLNSSFDDIKDLNVQTQDNITWGIMFNTKSSYAQNEKLRQAISLCIDRSRYQDDLPDYLKLTEYIIPPSNMVKNYNYRDFVKDEYTDYSMSLDIERSKDLYKQALSELSTKQIDDMKMIIPESEVIDGKNYFNELSQLLQKELNLFVAVEVLSQKDYNKALSSGSYDMALTKLESEYNNPLYMLNYFTDTEGKNISGFKNSEVENLIATAFMQDDIKKSVDNLKQAEQIILERGVFVPLFYQSRYLVSNDVFSGAEFSEQTGLINFRFIKTN